MYETSERVQNRLAPLAGILAGCIIEVGANHLVYELNANTPRIGSASDFG
jgi:hypothetical protein